MSRRLDDLTTQFRPRAYEFIARLTERGYPILIVDTLRTLDEHKANLAKGTSRSLRSFHLPRSMRWTDESVIAADQGRSDALDVCPYDTYHLNAPDKLHWDTDHPVWLVIGETAEALGLEWGGRWSSLYDPGHVQLPRAEWR